MAYRKLGRDSAHRKAMLREMTTQLIMNERIVTTETRAKEVRKTAEKMITLGKRGDLYVTKLQISTKKRMQLLLSQHCKSFLVM